MRLSPECCLLGCLLLGSTGGCDAWPGQPWAWHQSGQHGHKPPASHDAGVSDAAVGDAGMSEGLRIGLNFTGSTLNVDTFTIPPDTNGAVGVDQIVELLNSNYAVYSKSDGAPLQRLSDFDFWVAAGVTPSGGLADPRVLHDAATGRWFASMFVIRGGSEGTDQLLLAVSLGEDATAGWAGSAFDFQSPIPGSNKADFPTLGADQDGVYLYSNGTVLVVPKADLLEPTPSFARATMLSSLELLTPNGSKQQPVVKLDDAPLPELVIGAFDPTVGTFKISRVLGPISAPTLDTSDGFVTTPPFQGLGNIPADQPGSDIGLNAGNADFEASVVMRGSSLWGVHTIANEGHAALRWFEIDASTETVIQDGLIADPTRDIFMGSIAVNECGDVVIGFNASSDVLFASSFAVLGRTVDGVTQFGEPVLLKSGVAAFSLGGNELTARWGDYSTTVVDPSDPAIFWTFQEWPSAPNVSSTQITQLYVP